MTQPLKTAAAKEDLIIMLKNDIWCMDFKGWYITKDNIKFDPFTLTDHESRYLLRCNKLRANNTKHV